MAAAPLPAVYTVDPSATNDFHLASVGQAFYGLVNFRTNTIYLVASVNSATSLHATPANKRAKFQVHWTVNALHGGHTTNIVGLGAGHMFAFTQNLFGSAQDVKNGVAGGFAILKSGPTTYTLLSTNSGLNTYRNDDEANRAMNLVEWAAVNAALQAEINAYVVPSCCVIL